MKTAFDLEFPPSAAVIRTARDAAVVLAPELSEQMLDDVRLLVSELVTNSVRHAGLSTSDWVRVKVSVGAGHVRAEVSDPGSGFEKPSTGSALSDSGWGMYLVDQIADRWGVERNAETRVWFEIDV
jgi:anti-sigma regulatory factor (Ser/Thr protein kinase)